VTQELLRVCDGDLSELKPQSFRRTTSSELRAVPPRWMLVKSLNSSIPKFLNIQSSISISIPKHPVLVDYVPFFRRQGGGNGLFFGIHEVPVERGIVEP